MLLARSESKQGRLLFAPYLWEELKGSSISFIHMTPLFRLAVANATRKQMIQTSSVTFFFKDFIYLFMRDTKRERERERERQAETQEKQAPSREPDVGLYPQSPGSCPGLQVAPNRCTTGSAHIFYFRQRQAAPSKIILKPGCKTFIHVF